LDTIIDTIYSSIHKIYSFYDISTYSHKVKKIDKLNISILINNIDDPNWLYSVRESIIFILKKYKSLYENKFYIIKLDTPVKIKLFILYAIFFMFDSEKLSKKLYVGIDFEFNERKIALCQMAFFSRRTSKFIFIFNPTHLDQYQTDHLIKTVFVAKHITKIVHGADSLDIPYLFQELFMNNHEYIFDFVKNVIDTRFLCEYYKLTVKYSDKKCSIYDALLFFNVIDQNKYNELTNINTSIGPIYNLVWNIHNMQINQLQYALYDVIYLYDFYKIILLTAKKQQYETYKSYKYVILITRFIYLEKWNISNLISSIKDEIDPMNNYIVKYNNNSVTMINVFNAVIGTNMILSYDDKYNVAINNLLDINYFKSSLVLIFKKMVFYILTSNYDVYKNKKELLTVPLSISDIYKTLNHIYLGKLNKFFKLFYEQSYIRITKLVEK
jgi:hypothetical protein